MSLQEFQNGMDSFNNGTHQKPNDTVKLLFIGAPLLDMVVLVGEETRRQYGLKRDDSILARDEHNSLFQEIFHNPKSRLAAGGSSQNAARIAKWSLEVKGEVAIAGSTGCDDYEVWLRNKLQTEGVTPLYVKLPEERTGICACLLSDEGERSMVVRQGAAALFRAEHLKTDVIHPYVESSHCVFVEGYFIVHSPDVVFYFAEHRSSSQIFSLSLSAEYVCRQYCKSLQAVIPKVNVLFGNEAEVKALAEAMSGRGDLTVEECVTLIHRHQISETGESRIFVVTRGSKPLLVVQGGGGHQLFTIKPVENVVDSVGCGDALAGAFLANYIRTHNVESAIEEGIEAARQILQVTGCELPRKES
ncbi:uncharacterized protein LOC129971539 [Argiope bruennichi]|uniref:uncharacterized protein LOC129971539 n=1 Tax=Argiope bruennichi TaxID=94029 RepID=UPI0024940A62|nr:uncharacterized protein LOC129971539 [Argiope bruennichi]